MSIARTVHAAGFFISPNGFGNRKKALYLQHEYHNRSNNRWNVRPALRGFRVEVWR